MNRHESAPSVMAVTTSPWRKRRSTRKLRAAVLAGLRNDSMTPLDLAVCIGKRLHLVGLALDDLLVRGEVEVEDGFYRRVLPLQRPPSGGLAPESCES